MKIFTIITILLFTTLKSYAGGTAIIYCKSEHAKIKIIHSGFLHTLAVIGIAIGSERPHLPASQYEAIGTTIYIDEENENYGTKRFYLNNVFTTFHGPSYPIPKFELQAKLFGDYYQTIEKGSCRIY